MQVSISLGMRGTQTCSKCGNRIIAGSGCTVFDPARDSMRQTQYLCDTCGADFIAIGRARERDPRSTKPISEGAIPADRPLP